MTLRVLNQMGAGIGDRVRAAVGEDVDVVDVPAAEPPPAGLRGAVLFAGWSESPLIEHLDEAGVRWVHLAGTGVDRWPRTMFEGRTVTCARGLSAVPIAEFVLAAMLAFEKHLPDVWLHEPPERWNVAALGELAGRTLGLVGLGGIGTAVARRALAFDMRVVALRRTGRPSPLSQVEVASSIEDVLARADHLVLAAPATEATRHMVDAEALALVQPGVHLVNIARGALVDHDALRVALDDGRVALASLDTVEPEPLPTGHWLYAHPRVHLSAHVSWSSPRFLDRMVELFVANVRRFQAGQPLEGVVDAEEGY